MKRFISLAVFTLLASAGVVALSQSANAAPSCTPIVAKGKTIGKIAVDSVSLPIKSFNYPAGGVMEPQGSTLMAGLSLRHMPLNSTMGSSVVVWHRDYKGCANKLNILIKKKVGSIVKVTDAGGEETRYKITLTKVVKKGKYESSWFDLIGPRQIVLVTCTGTFSNGHYANNFVAIGKPI